MKVSNQIISYFVATPREGKTPIVFQSPVTMNSDTARTLIEKQLKNKGKKNYISRAPLLHVCYDLDSGQIYTPNASDFYGDTLRPLLQAAQIQITKQFGSYKGTLPIDASPFSSIRVRSLNNFQYAKASVAKLFNGKPYKDMPVIEANLSRMPSTAKVLPSQYHENKNFVGGYISPAIAQTITFVDEFDNNKRKRKKPIRMLTQQTPFILIDISPEVNPKSTEKEWAVISGYRDYLYDKNVSKENEDYAPDDISSFAHLYAAKRYLYLGWPFEEVCSLFFEVVTNFNQLIETIQQLMLAADSVQVEGYRNPASIPYYYSFKIDIDTSPLKVHNLLGDGNTFDPSKQINYFHIIDFDKNNNHVIIESPVYINNEICQKILKAKNRPFICRYNPTIDTIDVKSQSGTFKEAEKDNRQIHKIKALIGHDLKTMAPNRNKEELPQFRTDENARAISLSDGETFHLRKISDYYYACDFIKKMCEERNLKFMDVNVLVGPLEKIFGRGVQGGFMGPKQFESGKIKTPHEIVKGVFISPPIISVNSKTMPSYVEQTETLIHEYSHNLYSIANPDHEHQYNKDPKLKTRDNLGYWDLYLSDPDERLAHKEEIKYEIRSGKSIDEIIRNKISGAVSIADNNYPIALKFKEIVDEAVKELEREETLNEKPT